MQRETGTRAELLGRCLGAYIESGTIELSLDQLAERVGISKRMLVHYFGGRENIEEQAMALLEQRLRMSFHPGAFPLGTSGKRVVDALWRRTTAPESRGMLLVVMDLCRRAWSGSERAQAFYAEQQRMWVELLSKFIRDKRVVEQILQVWQGAVMAYLITGDAEAGRRSLLRVWASRRR